jgi:iron complex transport system substrate-binding protein
MPVMNVDAAYQQSRNGMRRAAFVAVGFFVAFFLSIHAVAATGVRDDAGNLVVLQRPAQRVVTLAPNLTELVFAAGGGDRIVGAVSYSDFPPEARRIPLVGDDRQIDMERLMAAKPDLLVAWLNGNSGRQLEQLRKAGIAIFFSEPRTLAEIPDTILRLGQLLGTETQAQKSAAGLRLELTNLGTRYRNRPPVRVFYQVWDRPLYTLNGRQIVSDVIRLCGGVNIFAGLSTTAPIVGIESVLLENPDAIVAGFEADNATRSLEHWKKYPALAAVRHRNLFAVNADLLSRPGPRMIRGAAELCEKIEEARNHLKAPP